MTCDAQVLKELNRPIVYSLSPGTIVTPAMAKLVSGLVNMYRITGDDWDTWGDVLAHFDVTRSLKYYISFLDISICLPEYHGIALPVHQCSVILSFYYKTF